MANISLLEKLGFRKGNFSDLKIIVSFQISMAKETEGLSLDLEQCTQGVRAVLNDPGLGEYFVIEVGSEMTISGCVLITKEWSDWRNGVFWWIQSLYVIPQFRRQGLFRALITYLRQISDFPVSSISDADTTATTQFIAGGHKVCGIRLYVDKRNKSAQLAYRSIGMRNDHYELFEWIW